MDQPGEKFLTVIRPHWERISIYDGEEAFRREFDSTESRARHLFAGHWCQYEICNGGFDQFFANSTGILAPEASQAFDVIGMHQAAEVVRDGIALFGSVYPRDRQLRLEALRAIDPSALNELDRRFYAVVRVENGGWTVAADRYANSGGAMSE